jgi:hypothetical protein
LGARRVLKGKEGSDIRVINTAAASSSAAAGLMKHEPAKCSAICKSIVQLTSKDILFDYI